MNQILSKLREVDSNNSEAVKDVLLSFFQNLSKHTSVDSFRCLRAIEDILCRFPKYCSSHRMTIDTYLAHFINSSNYFQVIEAAKCAHILQQVRPAQDKAATAKACWREHQVVLCNEAHKLIGSLFPNSVDLYKGSESGQKTQLQFTKESPLYAALQANAPHNNNVNNSKHHLLSTKLRNTFVFLQAILVEAYPVAKPIQPQTILEVIVRALTVSSGKNTVLDVSTIAEIKIQALRTLDALIACLGSNLLPFSALIYKMVLQTLRWSSEIDNEESRRVRCVAYGTASRWAAVGAPRAVDDLAPHALADMAPPPPPPAQLTLNSQPTKHLSKKAKRKLTNRMLQESSLAAHAPAEKHKIHTPSQADDSVTRAALEFAEVLLTMSGSFMSPSTYKMIVELLVRESYQVLCEVSVREGRERDATGVRLLRALEAARVNAPARAPRPAPHCLRLYAALAHHTDTQISTFCAQALLNMRLQLHSAPESISFALDAPETQKPSRKKKVSQRNRAALEALLGRQRISDSESNEEEVIDISEEPPTKRARTPSEVDKISLSSDSDEPFVIEEEIDDAMETAPTIETEVTQNGVEDIEPNCYEVSTPDKENVPGENGDRDEIVNNIEPSTEAMQGTVNDIHEAKTQLPLSNDTIDGKSSQASTEIIYDFPNTVQEKVNYIECTTNDNLPSTNETDDIVITCGQMVKNSQENFDKIKENGVTMNGNQSPEQLNGSNEAEENITNKTQISEDDVNVAEMLADFVDEINEEK